MNRTSQYGYRVYQQKFFNCTFYSYCSLDPDSVLDPNLANADSTSGLNPSSFSKAWIRTDSGSTRPKSVFGFSKMSWSVSGFGESRYKTQHIYDRKIGLGLETWSNSSALESRSGSGKMLRINWIRTRNTVNGRCFEGTGTSVPGNTKTKIICKDCLFKDIRNL
jgi:hypothetical protein